MVPGGGGRGVLQISSDRGDGMGAKINTQKNPWGFKQNPKISLDQNLTPKKSNAQFLSHQKIPESIIWYNYHESSNCFEYHQKNLLN